MRLSWSAMLVLFAACATACGATEEPKAKAKEPRPASRAEPVFVGAVRAPRVPDPPSMKGSLTDVERALVEATETNHPVRERGPATKWRGLTLPHGIDVPSPGYFEARYQSGPPRRTVVVCEKGTERAPTRDWVKERRLVLASTTGGYLWQERYDRRMRKIGSKSNDFVFLGVNNEREVRCQQKPKIERVKRSLAWKAYVYADTLLNRDLRLYRQKENDGRSDAFFPGNMPWNEELLESLLQMDLRGASGARWWDEAVDKALELGREDIAYEMHTRAWPRSGLCGTGWGKQHAETFTSYCERVDRPLCVMQLRKRFEGKYEYPEGINRPAFIIGTRMQFEENPDIGGPDEPRHLKSLADGKLGLAGHPGLGEQLSEHAQQLLESGEVDGWNAARLSRMLRDIRGH